MSTRALARFGAITATVMLAAISVAAAGPGGGGGGGGGHGGGGHGGGGGHAGGFFGGGRGSYGGWHGGYGGWHGGYGGWHGGYGYRGYGWRGGGYGWPGYGWRGGWGGWGWGLGVYVPFLPWYYDTYWWNGVPFYYADGNYYTWDGDAGEYQAVEPPQGLSSTPPQGTSTPSDAPAVSPELYAYPKSGQTEAQQKQDRDECSRWATAQTGFDPTQLAAAETGRTSRQAYMHAEAACLEARNYSVR